jgi:hypothetical protein
VLLNCLRFSIRIKDIRHSFTAYTILLAFILALRLQYYITMRTIEITYKIKGELKESSYNVRTSGEAIRLLLSGLSRRDKLSFKIVKISMI